MPVPKRKVSRARRDKRQANKGIEPHLVITCSHCEAPSLPHQVCETCGYYKGRKVLATKLDRSVKRDQLKLVQAQRKAERESAGDNQAGAHGTEAA
ncbi:MAG: 50S ribosomal protein L32 [Candidatus Babeliaceae bacterium]